MTLIRQEPWAWLPAACGFLLSGSSARALRFRFQIEDGLTADFPICFWLRVRGASLFPCEEAWSIGLLSFPGQVLVTPRCLFFQESALLGSTGEGVKGWPRGGSAAGTLLAGGEVSPVPFVGPADAHAEGWSPSVQDFLCSSVGAQPPQWPFPQPLSFLIRFFQLLLVYSHSCGATGHLPSKDNSHSDSST